MIWFSKYNFKRNKKKKVHKISKSQAWQRTGRAGRESSGTCYRLFTEAEFESMPLNTVPEILRSNLLSVALQLIALGIDDLTTFDFINKPPADTIQVALDELELLGAIKKVRSSEAVSISQNGHSTSNGHATNGHTTNGHGTNGHAKNGHSMNGKKHTLDENSGRRRLQRRRNLLARSMSSRILVE